MVPGDNVQLHDNLTGYSSSLTLHDRNVRLWVSGDTQLSRATLSWCYTTPCREQFSMGDFYNPVYLPTHHGPNAVRPESDQIGLDRES